MIEQLLKNEVQKYIKDHQHDDPFALSLKSKPLKDFPLREAIEQIQAFQKARYKIPSWAATENIIWPAPLSVEQSSSEATAKFKADLIHGKTMVDLTGGMGVDTSFFAEKFEEVFYVESEPELTEVATHNFNVLGKNNISICGEHAEEFLEKQSNQIDAIFIDPSRRVKDKKVFKIEDCAPNLYEIIPKCLQFSNQVLIKLSPLVDLSLLIRELNPNRIWVVGAKNEVKEVLCLIQNNKREVRIEAVMLKENTGPDFFKFLYHKEAETTCDFSMPLKYIYEPNAAIMKTGAFKLIGNHYGLKKLHLHTHLYTSTELVKNFPGKILEIKKQIKPNKKEISELAPNNKINVFTRNYPLTPAQLKKKYKLKDGGDDFLIGTTLMNGKKALLFCERV